MEIKGKLDEEKYKKFLNIFNKYGDSYVEVLEISLNEYLQRK